MFIGTHPPLVYRSCWSDGRKQTARHRPLLARPQWLSNSLDATGDVGKAISLGPGFVGTGMLTYLQMQRLDTTISVHGLVHVEPHQLVGTVFANLNREEQVHFDFLGCRPDAYSMRILKMRRFQHSSSVLTNATGQTIPLHKALFFPGDEIFEEPFAGNQSRT